MGNPLFACAGNLALPFFSSARPSQSLYNYWFTFLNITPLPLLHISLLFLVFLLLTLNKRILRKIFAMRLMCLLYWKIKWVCRKWIENWGTFWEKFKGIWGICIVKMQFPTRFDKFTVPLQNKCQHLELILNLKFN